jgi:hypothetical protein
MDMKIPFSFGNNGLNHLHFGHHNPLLPGHHLPFSGLSSVIPSRSPPLGEFQFRFNIFFLFAISRMISQLITHFWHLFFWIYYLPWNKQTL